MDTGKVNSTITDLLKIVGMAVLLIAAIFVLTVLIQTGMGIANGIPISTSNIPIIAAIVWALAVIILVAVERLVRGPENRSVIVGIDHRQSLSQAQIWWWTVIVIASYSAILVASRLILWNKPLPLLIPTLNSDLLVVLGLSSASFFGAKIIAGDKPTSPGENKKGSEQGFRELFASDDGNEIELHKFQMAAWTVVTILAFLIQGYIQVSKMSDQVNSLTSEITPLQVNFDRLRTAYNALLETGNPTAAELQQSNEAMQTVQDQLSVAKDKAAEKLGTLLALPNIGTELLFLMGISQAIYLGGKFYTRRGSYSVMIANATLPKDTPGKVTLLNPIGNPEALNLKDIKLAVVKKGTKDIKIFSPSLDNIKDKKSVLAPGEQVDISWKWKGGTGTVEWELTIDIDVTTGDFELALCDTKDNIIQRIPLV